MKIGTTKEKILNSILIAERVVGKKESLPILSCILIDAQKELIIRATNLEAGVEITVPAEIHEKGTIAVPATILSQHHPIDAPAGGDRPSGGAQPEGKPS